MQQHALPVYGAKYGSRVKQNAFLYGVDDMPLVIQTTASLINGFLNHLESFYVFFFILLRCGFQIYAGEVSTTFTRGMRR